MTRIQVLLFAAIVLAPVFSFLMRAVKRRLEGQASRDLGPAASVVPRMRTPPLLAAVATAPGSTATPRVPALGVAVAPTAADERAPSRIRGRREVRHGIVLMTVLGPCRALEPPGAR